MKKNRYAFCFIFDDSGRVLLIKRADFMRARPGEWDLPGGTIDEGETQESGVAREVLEETGLQVFGLELIVRKSGEWHGEHHEFSYYRATSSSTDIVLSEEHTEYEWHDPLVAAALVKYGPHNMGFSEAMRAT